MRHTILLLTALVACNGAPPAPPPPPPLEVPRLKLTHPFAAQTVGRFAQELQTPRPGLIDVRCVAAVGSTVYAGTKAGLHCWGPNGWTPVTGVAGIPGTVPVASS